MLQKINNKFQIKVTFPNIDLAGRIFYSRIFEFAQMATENFFDSTPLGSISKWFSDKKKFPVIVHCQADYLHPIALNDTIDITTHCVQIGKTSFTLEYIFRKSMPSQKNQIMALVQVVYILTHQGKEKIPLTPIWKKTLSTIKTTESINNPNSSF